MSNTNGKAIIEFQEVTKVYHMGQVEVNALQGVSFQIKEGELVAIVGPSGSGKSSVMNILGCLDHPSSGTYTLDGQKVGDLNDNQLAEIRRGRVGFVFQTFNLLGRMSALENVTLPLIYSRGANRRARALEALDRVGLSQRANHKPTELSGGEQQRVAIARALINNPSLILADEPTGNLDSKVGSEIMTLSHELNKEQGITVILVTRDTEVSGQARRIITMRDGLIVGDEAKDQDKP